MPYNYAVESFHTKKLCSRLSSRKAHFLYKKTLNLRLEAPFGSLGATYAVNLRLIGKLVVDLLLVTIELSSLCFRFVTTTRLTDRRTDSCSWQDRGCRATAQ